MAYTLSVGINLGSSVTSALEVQLVDTSGTAVSGYAATSAVNLGGGAYLWTGSVPDGFRGGARFQTSGASTIYGVVAINPETGENADVKVSTRVGMTSQLNQSALSVLPPNPSVEAALMLLYSALRNQLDTTATELTFYNDAGEVVAQAPLTNSGGTFTRGKIQASTLGPVMDLNIAHEIYQDLAGTVPAANPGDPIGLIKDQFGNNNNARYNSTAGTGTRPALQSVTNGGQAFPVARFDGSDDFLELVNALNVNGGTVYCVARWNALNNFSFCLGLSSGSEGYLRNSGTENKLLLPDSSVYTMLYQDGQQFTVNTSDNKFYVNDLTQWHIYAMPSNVASAALAFLGKNYSNNVSMWSGDLARLLVYNTAHTSTQREYIEQTLAAAYGITLV